MGVELKLAQDATTFSLPPKQIFVEGKKMCWGKKMFSTCNTQNGAKWFDEETEVEWRLLECGKCIIPLPAQFTIHWGIVNRLQKKIDYTCLNRENYKDSIAILTKTRSYTLLEILSLSLPLVGTIFGVLQKSLSKTLYCLGGIDDDDNYETSLESI